MAVDPSDTNVLGVDLMPKDDAAYETVEETKVVPPVEDRRNYSLHHHNGSLYAVRGNGDTWPELFARTGQTQNVRALASVDAVIHDGLLLDVCTDTCLVILQDPWAGAQETLSPETWRDTPFATYDRIGGIPNGGLENGQ